jgi:DNA-binding CsgD family transcriptional regulator
VDRWPFVGRGDEFSRLTAAIAARRGAVITGPAGVGKTTLAMACLQFAQERGMAVAHTTATHSSRSLPFGAFASILPPDPSDHSLPREDQPQLLRRYVRAVVEGAGERPLMVFVDDAHLLDDGSATLLHQLALTLSATVLAAVRSGEVVPDPVVALWKDGLTERIEVRLLEDAAIAELVAKALGAPVDAASVRQLIAHCQGNPLVLRELVTGAVEAGALVEEGGIWRLRASLRPTARLVELVALRVSDLAGPERAVLEMLALGEPLEEAELDQLADPASVEALERKGLITSRVEDRCVQVRLAHPVYGDVVRVGISALRERSISRSLAEVIEAAGGDRRGDTLRLASLRLVGGGGSAELLTAGAAAAWARHDHSLAERLARAAMDEGAGYAARIVAAEAAHVQGRPEQAEHELADLAGDPASDAERARVALLRFDNAFFLQGRADFRLLDDALDSVVDPSWRAELLARRSFVSFLREPRATIEAASTLLQEPPSGFPNLAHGLLGHSLYRVGRLDDAIHLLARSTERGATPEASESWEQWGVFTVRIEALVYSGRLGEAEELLTGAYKVLVDQPEAEARGYVTGWLALVYLEQGRVQSAVRRATESYTLFRQVGRTVQAHWPYIAAAQALALAGRADRAAEALAAHDALGLPTIVINETDLLQARAWTAAAAGDLAAARHQLEEAADFGEKIGDIIGATTALHGLARLGRASQVAPRLAALANEVDGDLVPARVAHADALAARDSEALDKVSTDFESFGAILYAAEAQADAAVLLRRAGRARGGAAAEQKALRLLDRCEGAATPSVRTITARARLTAGEFDTAVKAAAGRSNKQIAADMFLSVRTVESHLHHVYEKLGISSRRELTDALDDRLPLT